jgi:hypothetical protein
MSFELRYSALLTLTACITLSAAIAFSADPAAPVAKPTIGKLCTNCHKAEPNVIRGQFDNVAFKAKTIQVKIDDSTELIKFDEDEIKVTNSEGKAGDGELLRATKKGSEIKVEFVEKNGVKTAVKVSEKQPIKVSADKPVFTADVETLVALGPEKGKYTLVDSRPLPRFQEGAIPTAINIPYPAFDKMKDKLPADKNATLVFYCSGST